MIKKALGFAVIYVLPAAVVAGGFSAGHLLVKGETDRLTTHLIATGKMPAPEEPVEPAAAEEEVQLDANGNPIDPAMLLPTYEYFEMVQPFTGNFENSTRLYKIQFAFSVHKSKIEIDGIMAKLLENEPQIRPVIVTELIGLNEEIIGTREGRKELLARILTAVNAQLVTLEIGAVVEDVVITDLALT